MRHKVWLIIAAAVLCIPVAASMAESYQSYTFDEAVEQVQKNDLSTQTRFVPKLSADVQMYQSMLPMTELEALSSMQQGYTIRNNAWNSELSAYRKVYDYLFAKQSLELTARSLAQAENELKIVETEREHGVASDLEILQAKMAVTNAKKNHESAKMGYNIAERAMQQALQLELGKDMIEIELPSFSLLEEEKYDPLSVSTYVKEKHESLSMLKFLISAYNNILQSIDDLTYPSTGAMPTDHLEQQLAAIQKQIEAIQELQKQGPIDEQTLAQLQQLQQTALQLQMQIQQIQAANAQMPRPANLSKAKSELKFYYESELHNTKIQLQQQEQALELLSYTYAEQFKSLEKQLELQEQAIEDAKELYEKNLVLLENGMIRPADLEAIRLNVIAAEHQKFQLQKDYMILRKQFELFLEGHLSGM